MPRWIPFHVEGRPTSVDTRRVAGFHPIDARDVEKQGTILTMWDGAEMRVDEPVIAVRVLLSRAG